MSETSSPLRVVVVLPTIGKSAGGVSESARLFTAEWARRPDARVEVVALCSSDFCEARAVWPDIPIHIFQRWGPAKYGASFAMLRYLLRNDYDVAHVHGLWMFHALAALCWSLRFRRPVVVTPHGMLEPWILARSRLVKFIVATAYQNRLLRRTSLFHVLTPQEADSVRAVVPSALTVEVPNFVSVPGATRERPSWWRPEFENRRIFLFFGRIHEKKGWRELILAWDMICKGDEEFRAANQLVFCGWLDSAEGFVTQINDTAGRHGNVIFAGPQYGQEKLRSYASSDLFILPSKSEGLPMSVLEAWATGCSVMMTDECNISVAFDLGAAVRIGHTPDMIYDALVASKYITDERLDELRENGRKLQADRFSAIACADKLWANLRDVASANEKFR